MSKNDCSTQIKMLNDALDKMDKGSPYHTMWVRLVSYLSSQCSDMEEMKEALRGDGNGNTGLLQRMTTLESYVKVIRSDTRHMLNALRTLWNIDIPDDENDLAGYRVRKYSKEKNPGRREEDTTSVSDKILKYFLDKVIPAVITWIVLGWLAFQVAINNHLVIQVPK